jgi:hypothetical protein
MRTKFPYRPSEQDRKFFWFESGEYSHHLYISEQLYIWFYTKCYVDFRNPEWDFLEKILNFSVDIQYKYQFELLVRLLREVSKKPICWKEWFKQLETKVMDFLNSGNSEKELLKYFNN